jgi:hypothetical protein
MARCHFSRGLDVPLSKAYEYYSDIEVYTQRYLRYYSKIDVVDRSNETISTRQFLNVSLDENQDHVNVDVKYTFFPLKEIQYEIEGYGENVIKNSIRFRNKDIVGKAYQCAVEINHVPLDIMCYPPHSIERDMVGYNEYARMIDYFTEQDLEPLENKRWRWKVEDSCIKCGKGTLQLTGEREDTGFRKIEYFKCDYCASPFKNQRIETCDTLVFDDTCYH